MRISDRTKFIGAVQKNKRKAENKKREDRRRENAYLKGERQHENLTAETGFLLGRDFG